MAGIRDCVASRQAHISLALVLILTSVGSVLGFSLNVDAGHAPAAVLMAQGAPAPATLGASNPAPQQSSQGGPVAVVETRISELHKQLHITPSEGPQFKAYADVMRSNAQAMRTLFAQRAQSPDRSAIGMLRWYAKLTAAHANAVSKLVQPFEALYQSMSDDQKKVADAVFTQLRQRPPPRRAG
jgi:periplasmic protein CpxP/Spy